MNQRIIDVVRRRSWQRTVAREWLWALGSIVATCAFMVFVSSQAEGGNHYYNVPPNFWEFFLQTYLVGRISYWIIGVYATLQFLRMTIWAIRTQLRRR